MQEVMQWATILDTETTGFDNPEAVEVGSIDINLNGGVLAEFNQRYMPAGIISYGAMATHHILQRELLGCEPSGTYRLPEDVKYMIGHNVDYDWEVIGKPDVKRIDTVAIARKLLPELDCHKLGALVYYFFEAGYARDMLRNAHSALADVKMTNLVLQELMLLMPTRPSSWEELWLFSEDARVPTHFTFGKHNGEKICDTEYSYLRWFSKQTDADPYLMVAINRALKGEKW